MRMGERLSLWATSGSSVEIDFLSKLQPNSGLEHRSETQIPPRGCFWANQRPRCDGKSGLPSQSHLRVQRGQAVLKRRMRQQSLRIGASCQLFLSLHSPSVFKRCNTANDVKDRRRTKISPAASSRTDITKCDGWALGGGCRSTSLYVSSR